MKLLSPYCRVTVGLLLVVVCGGERAPDDGEWVARDYPPGLGEWMDVVRDSYATGTLSPLTAPAGDVP